MKKQRRKTGRGSFIHLLIDMEKNNTEVERRVGFHRREESDAVMETADNRY